METIKKWLAPIGALFAAVLYFLYKGKQAEVKDLRSQLLQQEAASKTAEASKEAAAAQEGFESELEKYARLKSSRPDLFPPSDKG
jgi:hypothetical protein